MSVSNFILVNEMNRKTQKSTRTVMSNQYNNQLSMNVIDLYTTLTSSKLIVMCLMIDDNIEMLQKQSSTDLKSSAMFNAQHEQARNIFIEDSFSRMIQNS